MSAPSGPGSTATAAPGQRSAASMRSCPETGREGDPSWEEHKAAEERADRILTAAKARGLLMDEPLSSGAPPPKVEDDKPISAEEALRLGYFKTGGKFDFASQDRR
jgi:hypothetical protein